VYLMQIEVKFLLESVVCWNRTEVDFGACVLSLFFFCYKIPVV
jgi:hypothetical protein